MPLTVGKFIEPDGPPAAGDQPTKSATVGVTDYAAIAFSGLAIDVGLGNVDDTSDVETSPFSVWEFVSGLSGDPGTGKWGLNNASPVLATELRIHKQNLQGTDVSLILQETNSLANILISKLAGTVVAFFTVTADPVPVGDYLTMDVTNLASSGGLTDGDPFEFRIFADFKAIQTEIDAVAAHILQDETVSLVKRTSMNFTGNGVEATDNAGNDRTDVTITDTDTLPHVIEEEGSPLTQQPALNFIGDGVTVTNNGGAGATDVTIPTPVFGTEYNSFTDGTLPASTSSVSFATLSTFTTPSLSIGSYRMTVYAASQLDNGTRSKGLRLLVDSVLDGVETSVEPNDATNIESYSKTITVFFASATTHTFELQLMVNNGADTATLHEARWDIFKVSDSDVT